MKQFLCMLMLVSLVALGACQTYEGIKRDVGGLDFSSFRTALSVDKDQTHSEFLIDGDCPRVEIAPELAMLEEKSSGGTLISAVDLSEVKSTCTYGTRSVTVDLKLAFNGRLGPQGRTSAGEKPFYSYPFFVAVTDTGIAGGSEILAKEVFAAAMTYDDTADSQVYHETLRQIIPADTRAEGRGYKIIVGFQLTKDQLDRNREVLAARAAEALAMEEAKQAQARSQAAAQEAVEPVVEVIETDAPKTAPKTAGPIDLVTQ